MAASAMLIRCVQADAAIARSALHSSRSHGVAAALVLLLAATATADGHSNAIYQLNPQTLEAVLAKWRIPCLLYRDWLDCSLLFSDYFPPNYYINYPSTFTFKPNQISPTYLPTPSLQYLTCKYSRICALITPIRHNGISILPNILRQLYERTLLIAPSTTANFPTTITENTFPSSQDTVKNVMFTYVNQLVNDYFSTPRYHQFQEKDRIYTSTVTPTMSTASLLTNIVDAVKSVSISPSDDQNTSVTNALPIPRASNNYESEGHETTTMPKYYIDVLRLPYENEYKLVTELDSATSIIDTTTTEISDSVMETTADSLNEVSKGDENVLEFQLLADHRHAELSRACEETSSSGPPASENIAPSNVTEEEITLGSKNKTSFDVFQKTLHRLERNFLLSSYTKLTAISPEERRVNGISFLQSGLFLHLLLIALTSEVDQSVAQEINDSLGLCASNEDRIAMLKHAVSWLPESSDSLKFRWSSRLVVARALGASRLRGAAAAAANLTVSQLATDELAVVTRTLNNMVTEDSGGTMRDTFEEEELSRGACGVALCTLYVRARWRAAPTLLNGTRSFRDGAASRATRFFRVNDLVRYASVPDWDVEAIDIPYATPGLSLLVVVPKEPSLGEVVARVAREGLDPLLAAARQLRAAVTLPLYTLRMTLLLPNKLQDMGMSSLVDANNTDCSSLKLSHAVQRIMFWAEAGRNAYKDDGIEWDPHPELEVIVDRPYLFFVRWHNVTLLNGNFVL